MLPATGLPIKNKTSYHITVKEAQQFFKSFKPNEIKFKVLFAIQMSTGRRISEVCAIHMNDFVPGSNFCKLWMRLAKARKFEKIVRVELSEVVAGLVSSYLKKRFHYIMQRGGWLFPHPNNRQEHTESKQVHLFLSKKRREIGDFMLEEGGCKHYRNYRGFVGGVCVSHGERRVPVYRFGTHSLRRLWITEAVRFCNDPFLVMQMINHENVGTTMGYVCGARAGLVREELVEELWGGVFFGGVGMRVLDKCQFRLDRYY